MSRASGIVGLVVVALALAGDAARAGCPSAAEIERSLGELDLDGAARTTRFGAARPEALYRRAMAEAGRPWVSHEGSDGFGVMIVDLDTERLWKAINDEDHHALGDDYLPVKHSQVVDGQPRGESRTLFQVFSKMGIGRWWVIRSWMSSELYAVSGGRLWELVWEDEMESDPPALPALAGIQPQVPPIESTRGAWLLVRLAEGCTLVEYFARAELGRLAGMIQGFLIERGLRKTLNGAVRMARDHPFSAHPPPGFLRPDGSPLD